MSASGKKTLRLTPVKATENIMQMLEDKGLILRLCPGHHRLEAKDGEISWKPIYEAAERFGPHKLITVTINTDIWFNFGYHEDNEEFLFIGEENTKPMYFVIGIILKDEMETKINEETLSEKDFIVLDMPYNNAQFSFLTLLKDVPHAELTHIGIGKPPSFYVTESKNMPTEKINTGKYEFTIHT